MKLAFRSEPKAGRSSRDGLPIDDQDLRARVAEVLDRWPSAGLAVGVVRGGPLEWFLGHGYADVRSKTPVTEDTVFRIGSITKTITAIAVMQLWEQGLVDLDAPASDYLRSFRLIPAKASLGPATVRHLLTHTAGIGYLRRLSDLLRPGIGSGDRAGGSVPSVADYYRRGLPVEVEPGTKWAYSNHGFATLGQIVEDVSGEPYDRYLRERVFDPLGMEHTDLVRSERVRPGLATGYVLRSRGLRPVVDREVLTPGAGSVYSTAGDMARYMAALLGSGANEHGSVLKPETLASMFEPHFQPDPRVPGMGLGFMLSDEGGHRTVGHGGIVSDFLSEMGMAPDDGIGVIALSNTGGLLWPTGAASPAASAVLRRLLALPDRALPGVPDHPEVWSELCGWYGPDPGPVTNLFLRAMWGAGAEVVVHGGHLMLRGLSPVSAMRRGLRLYAADEDDPYAFLVDMSDLPGPVGTLPVVFSREPGAEATALRLVMDADVFRTRPDIQNPRRLLNGMLAAGATALAVRRLRRAVRARRGGPRVGRSTKG